MAEHLYHIHVELEFGRGYGDYIGVAGAVVQSPQLFSSYLPFRLFGHFYAYPGPAMWLGVRYGVSTERLTLVG